MMYSATTIFHYHKNQQGSPELLQIWQAQLIVLIGEVRDILCTRGIHSTTNSLWLLMNYVLKCETDS